MKFFILLSVLALTEAVAPRAFATDFLPQADAFVDSAMAGNNYGKAGALGISATNLGKGEFDSFIRFDLSPLLAGTVQTIALKLTGTAAVNPLFNPNAAGKFTVLWIPDDSFIEGSGTPAILDTDHTHVNFTNHLDYLAGATETLGTFTYDGAVNTAVSYPLASTAGFLADVQARGQVTLYVEPADANVSYLFNSTDYSGPGGTPAKAALQVTNVPEPVGASLLAGGAGLLALRRRRLRHG